MKAFQKYATSVMKSTQPIAMQLTRVDEQFLWWNSNHSPGYKIDLTSTDATHPSIEGLKVDPADKSAVKEWRQYCSAMSQSGNAGLAADVYFDEKNEPVAVSVNGALAWKAGWWGTE